MAMTRQALELNDTDAEARLYMALELSDSKWKIGVGDNRRVPSEHSVSAGEAPALLALIEKARKRCGISGAVQVVSCYEAGRDGFWLHRWLVEHGRLRRTGLHPGCHVPHGEPELPGNQRR